MDSESTHSNAFAEKVMSPDQNSELLEQIKVMLGADPVSTERLAKFDELHVGGRAATRYLADAMPLAAGMRVLDIGSGMGGAARYFAEEKHVSVCGIDLSREYCEIATYLTQLSGLEKSVDFQQGDALALPFPEQCFDAVYSLHTAMNIEEKFRLYRETLRVLKPGGVFALYDVLAGEGGGVPDFPLPWARTGGESFLLKADDLDVILERAGFEIVTRENRTAFAAAALGRAMETGKAGGIALAAGPDAVARIANLSVAIADSRCAVWQVLCRRPGP